MAGDMSRRAFFGAVAGGVAAAAVPGVAVAEAKAGPAYRTVTELARSLAAKEVSASELVDAAITRIEALDPWINAVVVRDFERARAAAKEADAALDRGERKPLLGVPMTVKEQFHVAGLATNWGFLKFRDWRPEADALSVQRLKAAGAIVIGKTNVPTGLTDWQSFNEVYGTTNNPWDLGRTPGGSSGGAAAALAAGYVPLELGSDIGGSLRAPAHFCGVFSHKPSLDLVPSRGGGPPNQPAIPVRGDLAVVGPMARSSADLALALDVLAGPDELWDGVGYKLALPPPRHDKLPDYRVLVIDKHPLCPTSASITGALNRMADRLAAAGAKIVRQSQKLPGLAVTTQNYAELLLAGFSADLPSGLLERAAAAADQRAKDDPSIVAHRLHGLSMSHQDWIKASRLRNGLRARWQALFRDVDVVLCPVMPTTAFPHDYSPQHQRQIDVDGQKIPYDDQIAWATVPTLVGLPSTAMPIGHDEAGLPIGMQIIGGYLDDRTTIAFAGLAEREFGGFTPPPNLAG